MFRYLTTLILFSIPELTAAQVWRCDGEIFTSDASKIAILRGCQEFSGSRVCGSGSNKYFTPSHPGMPDVEEECSLGGKSLSPFVRQSDGNLASFKRNFERKLASTSASGPWGKEKAENGSAAVEAYRRLLQNSPQSDAIENGLHEFINSAW